MPIRKIKPSRQQAIRQYSGYAADVLSSMPYTTEELQDMQSYRDYLNEVQSQENAIRRAKQRREAEDISLQQQKNEYEENAFLQEFTPNVPGGINASLLRASNNPQSERLDKLTASQINDELALRENEKKNYMPDSVFESIINKTSEPNKESYRSYLQQWGDFFSENSEIFKAGRFIYNWVTNLFGGIIDAISIPKQQEEKREAFKEFHKYTPEAQKEAFNRYAERHGVTEKDIADGKKVIDSKQFSEKEEIFNKLTSPEAKLTNQYDEISEMIYDPRRNPESRFGSGGYWKDASTQFLINMNEAQIGDFQGRIDRSQEIVNRGLDAVIYEKNKERISKIDDEIHELAKSGDPNAGQKTQDLLTEKLQLVEDNVNLQKSVDLFKNYVPDGIVDRASLTWTNLLNNLEHKVFGTRLYDWTSPVFDDVDPLRLTLGGFNEAKNSNQKAAILQKYIDARQQRMKVWEEGIRMNEEDVKRHEDSHQISDYFKFWEQNASGNILSGDTWAFKQPGLMGFSNSSWIKQLPMYIGAVVAPFAGNKAALMSAALGFLGGHSSAYSENYMELRDNLRPRVQRNIQSLGDDKWEQFKIGGMPYVDERILSTKSDEEIDNAIIDAFLDGRYRPTSNVQEVYQAFVNSTRGINALFDRDMLAVDIDNLVNTAVMFGPYAKLGGLTKFVEPMAKGGSPIIGYANEAFKFTPLGKKIYKGIDDATSFLATVPKKIYDKAKKIAPSAFKTPRMRNYVRELENAAIMANKPGASLAAKTAYENLKNITKAVTYSGLSEGIEEGKQYLGGQAFQRGDLDDSKVSFGLGLPDWGKWYDDMVNDIRSAYVIAGIPFNLESTHDAELVENIKGGIMGGLFQTGVSVTARTLLETPNQFKLNKYLLNNIMAEKAARTDLYEKAKLYSSKSFSDTDVAYIRRRFDDMKNMNDQAKSRNADWVLPDGVIDEMKQLFEAVYSTTHDQAVLDRAEQLGIIPGTEDFDKFIAQLALQTDQLNKAVPKTREIANQIVTATQMVDPIYKYDEENGRVLRRTGNQWIPYSGEQEIKADGTIESKEEMVNRLNTQFSMQHDIAVSVKAVRDLLAQLNVSDDGSMFGNSRTSINFLKHRLESYIQKRLEYINPKKKDEFLKNLDTIVKGIDNSEHLLELHRKLALAQVDQDYASMMYQGLMGKYSIHETQAEPIETVNGVRLDFLYDDPNWNTTFKNINDAYDKRLQGDNALYDALEQDYIERLESIERNRENERKKIFLEQNPGFAEQERQQNEQRQIQSHITATDKTTKQQVSYDSISNIAKKIKDKKASKNKTVKDIFRKAGITIDPKYADVVYNSAKQLARGEITEQQFAMLFVPQDQREQYREQKKKTYQTPDITSREKKKEYVAPDITTRDKKKTYIAPDVSEREKKKEYSSPATEVGQLTDDEIKQYLSVEQFLDLHPNTGAVKLSERFDIDAALARKFKRRYEVNRDPRKQQKQANKKKPKEVKQNPPVEDKKIQIVDSEDVERFEELKKRALAILSGKTGQVSANPLAELLPIAIEMGFYIIKHGTREFIAFGKAMIEQLGDGVRPVLKSVYEGARYFPGAEEYRDDMTSSEDVARINENTFDKEDPLHQIYLEFQQLVPQLEEIENVATSIIPSELFENQNDGRTLTADAQHIVDLLLKLNDLGESLRSIETTESTVERAGQILSEFKQIISNVKVLIARVQADGPFQQQPARSEQGGTLNQNSYEQNVKAGVETLSFYSTKIANNQQLSGDEINNLNGWIAWIKQQLDQLNDASQPGNIYETLINYYDQFVDMGITGSGATVISNVQIGDDKQTGIEWRDYNTLRTMSLNESRAIDDENIYLRDFTSNEDFLTEAKIELKIGGKTSLEEPIEEGSPGRIYAIFTYKGHTFTPVMVWDTESENVSKENAQFGNQVRELIRNNPGKKIVPLVVSKTKGIIWDQPNGEKVSLTDAGLVQDVYAISFDNDQNEFMLTRAVPVAGGKVLIRATKPNKTGRGISAPYTYSEDSKIQTAGNVVYIKEIKDSNRPYLPINIYSADITEGDADLIIDILTGRYTGGVIGKQAMDMPFILNGEYLGTVGPERTIGLTARDVLNLILPYGPFGRKGTDIVHIWHSNFGESRIIISGKFKGDDAFTDHEFNLATTQGKTAFKQFLMEKVHKNISERIMKSSLGKPGEQKDNPMLGLANFVFSRQGTELRKRLQAGEQIQLGESSIVFDWDDLSNEKRQGGITGLGWYVKRGFLLTKFAGINNALINFTGAKVETDTETKSKETAATVADNATEAKPVVAEEKPQEVGQRRKTGRVRRSLEKRTSEESNETRTINEVRSILAEIIPAGEEELKVRVSENYLDDDQVKKICAVSASAPHVVGRCYSDMIELYQHANLGVAYHEAFHRISEIFLDDDERERVYKRYERFYRLTHFGKRPSLDEIREGTADQFMLFMENRPIDLGNRVLDFFNKLFNTIKFIVKIGSYGQYKLYSQIAAGRFKNFEMDDAAKARAERFAEEHPVGYGFTLEGQTFKYILNEHAFKDLVNSLVYFAFHANNISQDGSNINELAITREVIEQSEDYQYYTSDNSLGSLALQEAMEHFEIFAPYVVSAISEFATDYRVVIEDNNQEEAESEYVSAASISEHTHQSYEFSQFSRASSKVRFFFSRIDDMTTKEVDGVAETVDKLNGLGLPQFMNAKSIFNDVLNQLWDIEDLNDMMNRIAVLSKDSPVYEQIYNRLNKIKSNAYDNGYNADQEALLVQIYNIIKSNKQSFLLAQASRYYVGRDVVGYTITLQNTDQEYNARNYRFEWSNLFAKGGSIFVEVGEDGKIRPKKNMTARSMSQYWNLITNIDPTQKLGIAAAFSDDPTLRKKFTMVVVVDGKRTERQIDAQNNKQDLDLCKIKFIQILNCFGIQFDKAMLDYMLRQKYGDSGFDGMKQMFEETGVASLNAVTFYMNGTYYEEDGKYKLNLDEDGRLNGRKPEEIFAYRDKKDRNDNSSSNGFFGELANYKYQYRHAHDQLSVLAAAGNKYYVISENNYITDTTHFLNRAIKFYQANDERLSSEIEEFDELCNFSYNLIEDDYLAPIGSVIIKSILNRKTSGNIEVCTFSGMKSDYRGDNGVDYATISRRDDYIAKLQILLNGGIIFPTMSDKKTWTFLRGILLPGINWASKLTGKDILRVQAFDPVSGKNVVDNHGRIRTDVAFSYMLQNKDEVVDQLIEYFITEHAAISEAIADYKTLPENRRVDNYHRGGKKAKVTDVHGVTHTIIQGCRHSSLLNLYDENDQLIPISRTLDENGEYIDEETEWNTVNDLFFKVREEEGETEQDLRKRQRIYVNRILRHRLEEELTKLEQLGLVKKIGPGNTIFDYENIGIDAAKVEQVYNLLLSTYGVQEGSRPTRGENGETIIVRDLEDDDIKRFKALALATVINDGMVKAIMSKNETERVFSGHPSFFKWEYNANGELVDRGVDQHKRYGGLVSTGQNAALWARGVNAKYRSAEIDNEEVASSQLEFFRNTIYEGTLRSALINYVLDKKGYSVDDDAAKEEVSRIDRLSLDEVKEELKLAGAEYGTDMLSVAEMAAKEKINDFTGGIDVADGAAYVTDTFFEQMLRSIGSWDSKIERAFKILRGEEVDGKVYTLNDINEIAEATEAVHTAVIGSQKYTAFGQRMQAGWDDETGEHHDGRTMIPFYDKFALFPLFKIICTGKMAHIYKAMQDQNVDMLKIKSATKLGNEGSQKLDWTKWADKDGNVIDKFHDSVDGFKFNVYEQRMKYLRKQFNTDPKEKEYLTMGTQMTKVVMQALTAGRMYTTQDGRTMSAKELRDDVMKAMINIARLGNDKFRKEFFNADGSMNLQAFTKMIKDELSRRGASRDIIDGFSIIKDSKTGEEKFKISPSAQSDISWIQSIIASVVNKRIIDINTPGNLFIQRSIWGMEGVTHLMGDTNLPKSINRGQKLKFINEEGSMDCVLSIDFFEHIIPKVPVRDSRGKIVYKTDGQGGYIYRKDEEGNIIFDENGNPKREAEMRNMSFSEAKQWLIDNEIISGVKTGETEWNNAKANIVGYRIPTQAVSSIHAFRCVDVLPVLRDTVIMPEEITKVTGSDFKQILKSLNFFNCWETLT